MPNSVGVCAQETKKNSQKPSANQIAILSVTGSSQVTWLQFGGGGAEWMVKSMTRPVAEESPVTRASVRRGKWGRFR